MRIIQESPLIKELEELFFSNELFTYDYIVSKYSQDDLSFFSWKHGVYALPTKELIYFLISQKINLEIGTGFGLISKYLKHVILTDNKLQERPDIVAQYKALNQPVIKYYPKIEQLDGNAAVDKYKPKKVLACWVTQKWKEGITLDGNVDGVDEEDILSKVDKYIFVGNTEIHKNKIILDRVKETIDFPMLSRTNKGKNVIWIF